MSVIIPFYEVQTILRLVEKTSVVRVSLDKEILICEDGSEDGTHGLFKSLEGQKFLRVEFLEDNLGRGGVIRHL